MIHVPPYIGPNYKEGGILVVGRDPGATEMRTGVPFTGRAGGVLDDCLQAAGIRRKDIAITNIVNNQPPNNVFAKHTRRDVERGRVDLADTIQRLRPNLCIALGNEASFTLVDDWPSKDGSVYRAGGILDRRGYLWWSDEFGVKVLTTIHPASLLHGQAKEAKGINAKIGKMLLIHDLRKGKENSRDGNLNRPIRRVDVVTTIAEASLAYTLAKKAEITACDIETSGHDKISCIGFAPSPDQAYVFPPDMLGFAFEILQDPNISLVFQNGNFDTYFLKTRYGVETRGYDHDTQIAFHCLWPEIAGKGEKSSKRTAKSLHFFASLYTTDEWWKDYEFASDHECYVLNGKDCCITLECLGAIREHIGRKRLEPIYTHEMSLLEPLRVIEEVGITVDNNLRLKRLEALRERQQNLEVDLLTMVEGILVEARDSLPKPHLFWKKKTCKGCRNGRIKRQTCEECEGVGQWEEFSFNPNANEQKAMLLYDALKIPRRSSVDEETLKDLLGVI